MNEKGTVRVFDLQYNPATNCSRLSYDGKFSTHEDTRKFLEFLPDLSQELPEVCKAYNYSVRWDNFDSIYIAGVAEFPLLKTHGDIPEEALGQLYFVLMDLIEDMEANDEPLPEPRR